MKKAVQALHSILPPARPQMSRNTGVEEVVDYGERVVNPEEI